MRKYFLLSAVALLATTSANATTDYAEVTAKATIEVAGTFECNDIDYGTIVVKQNNEAIVINDDGTSDSADFISMSGSNSCFCTGITDNDAFVGDIGSVVLKSGNNEIVMTDVSLTPGGSVYAPYLNIPANVEPGEYTGSFTITYTY